MLKPEKFVQVLSTTIPLSAFFYLITGSLGYVAFRENIRDIFLFNFGL